MKIFNWFKQLLSKKITISVVMKDKQLDASQESQSVTENVSLQGMETAYERILKIVTHIFQTLGIEHYFTVEETKSGVQLTLSNMSGTTRVISFNTPEELYACAYGLHLAKDIFHIKPAPPAPGWAEEALKKPEAQVAYHQLQHMYDQLQQKFNDLTIKNQHLQTESTTNYNRRCVAENFLQVFRNHVRRCNAALDRILDNYPVPASMTTDQLHVCVRAVREGLEEIHTNLKKDGKRDLLSKEYLETRGEPAEAEA